MAARELSNTVAMKKEDMERHREQYYALMAQARAAHDEGLYHQAVELAISTWDHIDGMMQYERKYEEKVFDNVEGISMVLQYAPLLLNLESLEMLESLLKDQRRIDRNTSESVKEQLAKARELLWEAHRMWEQIERRHAATADELFGTLGGKKSRWRLIAEEWEKMGLLRRIPKGRVEQLALSTRMDEVVLAKCPTCGVVAKARKSEFLEEHACPSCCNLVTFVILVRRVGAKTKE